MKSLTSLSVGNPMSKSEYRERRAILRRALMNAQAGLRESSTAALLLLSGVDGAGKSETVRLLNEWMDPRWIRTHGFEDPSTEEDERPDFWRYWRRLPPRGEIALFLSAWYSRVLLERVNGASDASHQATLARIRRFEKTLADDGMLIFKLWLHLDADAQEKRFRELEADPLTSWRVVQSDWDNWSRYDEFTAAADETLAATDTEQCRWHLVEASNDRRRAVDVGDALIVALRAHATQHGIDLSAEDETNADDATSATVPIGNSIGAIDKSKYRTELARLQGNLNALYRDAHDAGVSVIGVFEGRDAAGKGGAIRRVVAALDARTVDVARIGPPSDDELMHHYLWRFWSRIPRAGYVTLFDRSWYGRVLAERVEELATPAEWGRAYDEINDFERQIVEDGAVVVKFWLEIDRDEQKKRFEDRSRIPHKRWKLTESDRRNRRLWKEYDAAIAEMFERTSSDEIPWKIVPAKDKRHARLEVLRTLIDALETRLGAETAKRGARMGTG
jgi:polyphosphate:AMP phosphotransferase